MIRRSSFVLCALVLLSNTSLFAGGFPTSPNQQLTPGEVCGRPSQIRYPERIAYCERDVDSTTKYQVIENYEKQLGYSILAIGRYRFKIDHYIPLCMGGANTVENLWPQHESIYALTDPLEAELCKKMSDGKLLQNAAIEMIKKAKANPRDALQMFRSLRAL